MMPDEHLFFAPAITEESLIARIRKEIGRNRPETPLADVTDFDASGIRAAVTAAEAQADIGTEVPPMQRIPAPLRRLARLSGKIIIRLAGFITVRQRSFNRHVLNVLRLMTDAVEQASHIQKQAMNAQSARFQQESARFQQEMEAGRKAVIQDVLAQWAVRNAAVDEKLARQERAVSDLIHLKTSMVLLERRIAMLLEEARKRLPAPFDSEQLEKIAAEGRHSLDAFYVALENRFRGSREQILERLQVYLPHVRRIGEQTAGAIVLDIGCGRGEWLELLYREGIQARGVDTNRLMIDQCRERCLEVVHEDALAYMRSLPDAGIGVVTGFHIIEHLPFEILIQLMGETLRVLKPGGMVIFETPNPQNVLVGSCNFYLDPTHLRPLPSQMMKFITESCGFADVEILDLNPSTATRIAEDTDVAGRFNDYFYGAMEYAVIGRKG